MRDDPVQEIVVDTGPLSHLAEAGALSVLRFMAGIDRVIITEGVRRELELGLYGNPHLRQVLGADWLTVRSLTSSEERDAFRSFAERLVVGTRNIGEAEVLAYAKTHGAVALVDDGAGRKAAKDHGVELKGTLGLLCDAVRAGDFSLDFASDLTDYLLETEYRLPFTAGGFKDWAQREGLC